MRTILYRLTGRHPRSLDDWVDALERERRMNGSGTISLVLEHEESVAEGYLVHTFLGCYRCDFESGGCTRFRKIYGGFLGGDGDRRRQICRCHAESRLDEDLGKLTGLGYPLEVSPPRKRFP